MLFEIKNRFSGKVQFTATIECDENASIGIKVGLAVRWAYKSNAVLRGAVLRGAVLRGAVLSGADLSRADLRHAVLRGAVLSGADLRHAVLSGADLSGADLSGADLRGADLSGADLSDVPKIENIDAKILAAIEQNKKAGTNGLKMSDWHGDMPDGIALDETNWCKTTHCRAGYAVCIAGKEGFELERKVGPATAGALLYLKSTPDEPIPDFYCSNDEAMKDIRARAARQLAKAQP